MNKALLFSSYVMTGFVLLQGYISLMASTLSVMIMFILCMYIYPHCFICLMYVYFMYMPSWWKKSLGLHVSYVDPVCCVATVCHQVRCVYWGHLGYFYRAISHLKWRKIVCMGCVACAFIQMKSINMFFMFFHSGVPKHFRWRFIAVWIYNLTVFMYMYVNDLKL